MERKHGKRTGLWTYHDANGNPVGVVVRWDKASRKDIRPVTRHGDHWTIGGMSEPRPLYCLPDLASAARAYIVEGEPAADAVRSIELAATTPAHGSQSPEKTDWAAGKECVMMPDNDDAGDEYAATVQAIVSKLSPAPVFKIAYLPDLPHKGDRANFVAQRRAAGRSDAEIRAEVEALADKAEAIKRDRLVGRIERFQPFPTDALPEPIRGFVIAGAKAIDRDASYLALPMLTALAAAIGNTRRIQLKRGWSAPAIIWTAIVGESGTSKTSAFKLVVDATDSRAATEDT